MSGLVAVLVLVGLMSAPLLLAPSARADEPYPGTVGTSCTVRLDADASSRRLRAAIDVGTTGSAPVRGAVTAVFSGPAGELSRVSKGFTGEPVRLQGPTAPAKGRYDVRVAFVPQSGSVFTRCADQDGVDVGVGAVDDGTDGDDPGNDTGAGAGAGSSPASGGVAVADGVLPDTGGPAGWLLPLATACVLLGLALVVTGRRRRPAAR